MFVTMIVETDNFVSQDHNAQFFLSLSKILENYGDYKIHFSSQTKNP